MASSTAPRETEGLVWRGSSELRAWVKDVANQDDASQNTVMTAALLVTSTLDKKLGPPRDILALFDSISDALGTEMLAWGNFHSDDWASIQDFLKSFVNAKLITEPKTKESPEVSHAIAYSFRITRVGAEALPRIIAILRPVFKAFLRQQEDNKSVK